MSDDFDFEIPTDAEQEARGQSDKLYERATEAAESGRLDEAIDLCRRAIKVVQGKNDYHRQYLGGRLADLLVLADRADEARTVLETLIGAGTDLPFAGNLLHQIYLATDDFDAIARFIRSTGREAASKAVAPYFFEARSILNLASRTASLAEHGVRDDRAIELAERLTTEIGNTALMPLVQHQRGLAAEALGDIDEAIRLYHAFVVNGSRHEPTVTRLLLLLEREGRAPEALTLARQLSDEPSSIELRADLAKRIDRLSKKKAASEPRVRRGGPTDDTTFGRRARNVYAPIELLSLERSAAHDKRFEAVDRLTAALLSKRLAGSDIGDVSSKTKSVLLTELDAEQRGFLDETFGRKALEARGAWFLPERISVQRRLFSPRLGWDSAGGDSADAIFVWSLLGPLYEGLHHPLETRASVDSQTSVEWPSAADLFEAAGLDPRLELDVMAHGGGWSRLQGDARRRAQARIGEVLREWAPQTVRRYRALKVIELIGAYYAKADATGRALRTKVVTAPLRPTMIAFFRGDWLEFLDYLGEKPHPGEQIVTALPEARVVVAGESRIAAAAAALGVSAEQAALIGQALWGSNESPVEARARALKEYWAVFDGIHTRQADGTPSLWGLVEERGDLSRPDNGTGEHNPGQFRRALPTEVLSELNRLWGGQLMLQRPEKILSAIAPHVTAAETFGVALKFWHGVALTAWFVCKGPMSRTTIENMETYYARDLEALSALGAPIDRTMFEALVTVKSQLKPLPAPERSRHTIEIEEDLSRRPSTNGSAATSARSTRRSALDVR